MLDYSVREALEDIVDVDIRNVENQRKTVLRFAEWNYRITRTNIVFEGEENIPEGPFILAMNHTDAFNSWPIGLRLYQEQNRFGTAWVKRRSSERVNRFLKKMGMIRMPSKGELIQVAYQAMFGKDPKTIDKDEFRVLKGILTGKVHLDMVADPRGEVVEFFAEERDNLNGIHEGLQVTAAQQTYDALQQGIYLIVYPEGTRSTKKDGFKLQRGQPGLARFALHHHDIPIIPVGCENGHRIYPWGNVPLAMPGTITYRIGKPIGDFTARSYPVGDEIPFSERAKTLNEHMYRAFTDEVIMPAIMRMLPERYHNVEVQQAAEMHPL